MKVKFIGTGNMSTLRRNTSFIVNESVLFDIGFGTVHGLIANGLDVAHVKVLVISHFHGDHFGDIVYFLFRRHMQKLTEEMLTIIGPWGLQQKVIEMANHLFGDVRDYSELATMWNIRFVELSDGANLNLGNCTIEVFKVVHGKLDANGYIIRADGKSLGYTGDASMSDGIMERIPDADTWIVDTNDLIRSEDRHMGFTELIGIANMYKSINFYAVHRGDYDTSSSTEINLFCPFDNEEFIAK